MSDSIALQSLAAEHGVEITADQSEQLARYCRCVWNWNERLNLTRHTDWSLFVTRDLIDSVKLAEYIPLGATVLDVGSGGGVPGIVLAILRADLKVSLSESVQKKALALQDIVSSLSLPVPVHTERAEAVLKSERFNVVTVRAVAAIGKLLTWLSPAQSAVGELLLIKGPKWVEEQADAIAEGVIKSGRIEVVTTWPTPGRDHESVLLRVRKPWASTSRP